MSFRSSAQGRARLGALLTLLALLTLTLLGQSDRSPIADVRDQVMLNTGRLQRIESQLENISLYGTNADNALAIKVGALEAKLDNVERELLFLRDVLFSLVAFAALQIIALFKFYIALQASRAESQRGRHTREN